LLSAKVFNADRAIGQVPQDVTVNNSPTTYLWVSDVNKLAFNKKKLIINKKNIDVFFILNLLFILLSLPVVARSLLAIPPHRRCEVTACYPHEAISVSLPRISPPPVVARFLLAILTKQSPCHFPDSSPLPVVARSLISSLRGHFLLSSRSNLRVTSPNLPPSRRCEVTACYSHEAISVSLPPVTLNAVKGLKILNS